MDKKGFTLIELMIVVAIVGILATIGLSNFMLYKSRSKQAEAKTNLCAIGTSAVAYRAEHDTFIPGNAAVTDVSNDLGWVPHGKTRFTYSYGMSGTGKTAGEILFHNTAPNISASNDDARAFASISSFTAEAAGDVGKGIGNSDIWVYDQMRGLSNPVNGVGL